MGIVSWIILGGLAGWVASMIMHRNDQMGCLTNILVGVVGGVVGGLIMNAFGKSGMTGFNLRSFLVALVGAVLLLFVVNLFSRR